MFNDNLETNFFEACYSIYIKNTQGLHKIFPCRMEAGYSAKGVCANIKDFIFEQLIFGI